MASKLGDGERRNTMEGGSKRILVTTAWDLDTYNAAVPTQKDIPSTDHIVIQTTTALTSLVCDWLAQDGTAVTSVTLEPGRYEMNAKSFSCDNQVIIIVA